MTVLMSALSFHAERKRDIQERFEKDFFIKPKNIQHFPVA